MAEARAFRDLLRRVRAGDQAAATELVRVYAPAIRRAVRVRMADDRLRRVFDSSDICQSVLASFFACAALGQYELESHEELLQLLVTMARNMLVQAVRKQRTKKYDHRRLDPGGLESAQVADSAADPARLVSNAEMHQEVTRRLPKQERVLLELPQQGYTWNEIAEQWGGKPNTLRMRLDRAVAEVARQLGWDEIGDE
jgi:RNA polymerase sigma-70 factor (ECF subfamily)